MKPNEYQCAVCEGIFEKDWSDEEAKSELEKEFPGNSPEDCAMVCDTCYKRMGFAS